MIDNVEHKYLSLFVLLSLRNENISNTFDLLLFSNSATPSSLTQFKKIPPFAQTFKAKKSKH